MQQNRLCRFPQVKVLPAAVLGVYLLAERLSRFIVCRAGIGGVLLVFGQLILVEFSRALGFFFCSVALRVREPL